MEPIILNINVPPAPVGPGDDGNGLFSFIYRGDEVKIAEEYYGRDNCCLKIFKNIEKFQDDYNKQWWGFGSRYKGSLMKEAVLIQNIYAMEGLAPRVYAVFQIKIKGKKYWAHLIDDLGHWDSNSKEQNDLITGPMVKIAKKYGIEIFNDDREHNVVGHKYVDFQGFHLKDNYENKLKDRLKGTANIGKWGPWMNYHDIPELGIGGGRDNLKRVKDMHLDEIDFKGKTVLDIGCAEGFFCRYVMDKGAKRVLGIDLPGVIEPTKELSYYLGYNNIDYLGCDLKKESPIVEDFDIVFFFSMVQHIGFPSWLRGITNELLVFEGNGKTEDLPALTKIETEFGYVNHIGKTDDLLIRPVVWAKP